jgi:Ferritin-like domain
MTAGLNRRGALLAGAGAIAGGILIAALPDGAASEPSARQDAEILNFALVLEHVQAALYAEALGRNVLQGELRDFARVVGGHEQAHIDFIRHALGRKAKPPPKLEFGEDASTPEAFQRTALKLEDLGIKAYDAQAPNLTRAALTAAARIVSVEARHAAWIRAIAGQNPAPDAAEPVIGARRVVETLNGSGFVR